MTIEINAQVRSDLGKGASRRLRHEKKVPAIIYGSTDAQAITIEHKDLWKAQENTDFFASIIGLTVDGKTQNVVIKDLQRHPAKALIMHADFQRVDDSKVIIAELPLRYINGEISPAVKLQGGKIQIVAQTVKVRCLPSQLPTHIEMDLRAAKAGQIFHISSLTLPEGVESVELLAGKDRDQPIAIISGGKGKAAGGEE